MKVYFDRVQYSAAFTILSLRFLESGTTPQPQPQPPAIVIGRQLLSCRGRRNELGPVPQLDGSSPANHETRYKSPSQAHINSHLLPSLFSYHPHPHLHPHLHPHQPKSITSIQLLVRLHNTTTPLEPIPPSAIWQPPHHEAPRIHRPPRRCHSFSTTDLGWQCPAEPPSTNHKTSCRCLVKVPRFSF